MKGLIITRQDDMPWLDGVTTGHRWGLDFLDSSVLGNNLAFLRAFGIHEIRILTDHAGTELEARLPEWANPDSALSLRTFQPGKGLLDLLLSQKPYLQGEEALVIPGPLVFEDVPGAAAFSGFAPHTLRRGRLESWALSPPFVTLSTVRDYFLAVLRRIEILASPALSPNEAFKDCWFGPEVKIGTGSRIGPRVVLGSGVRVGKGCEISDTVVSPGVRIGDGVVFKEKLILGRWVFHPAKGTKTKIDDRKILN